MDIAKKKNPSISYILLPSKRNGHVKFMKKCKEPHTFNSQEKFPFQREWKSLINVNIIYTF